MVPCASLQTASRTPYLCLAILYRHPALSPIRPHASQRLPPSDLPTLMNLVPQTSALYCLVSAKTYYYMLLGALPHTR